MGAEIIDDIFSKNENTNVRSTSLTCKNYTFFSCPKEMFDIFQRAANEIISGGILPKNFITSALLSDMSYKTRMLVTKEYSLTFFIISILYSSTFLFFYTPFIFLIFLIISSILFIISLYFAREAYWYSRIEGFKVDNAISKNVTKNTTHIYKITSIGNIIVYTIILALWLFYIYFNINSIVIGVGNFAHSKFAVDIIKLFSIKLFTFINKTAYHLSTVNYSNLKLYFITEILFTFILLYFNLCFWLKKGIIESNKEVKNAYKEYNLEQKYIFEKALDILNKKL